MSASINDKFNKVINGTTRPSATTLTAQKSNGATTATVASTTGWDTTTALHGIMYRTDTAGNKIAASQIDWKATVSGTTLSNFTVTAGTDDIYEIGSIVELAPTAAWGDDFANGMEVEHNQDGTHSDITADSIVVSGTITVGGTDVASLTPPGVITQYAGSTAPTNWLICDGSAISRSSYSALFAIIGTTYGAGNGTTTFNIPNLKGKIPVGLNSSETEFDTLGETGGAKTHTLSTAEMPSHSHTGSTSADGNHAHNYTLDVFVVEGIQAPSDNTRFVRHSVTNAVTDYQGTHSHSFTTATSGSSAAHNNLQPYITVNYIIKV